MNSKNERIKCPSCLSENTTVIEHKEKGPNYFVGLCSNCGEMFQGYANPVTTEIKYEDDEKCCTEDKTGRSSESYEEEIGRLKYDKEQLLLAIENLNRTINILMIQIIRKG